MNYCQIKKNDIANGTGVRVSLFVSGCTHRCEGCFNACAWDFEYGEPFDADVEDRLMEYLAPDYVQGLSLLGGEPFEKANQLALLPFLLRVRERYPQKDVWCYTGYLWEDIFEGGRAYTEYSVKMLDCIDVLVDGPFVLKEKNISLKFRGSENQRIINVAASLDAGRVILAEL